MKTLSVKVKLVKYKPMSNFAEEISYIGIQFHKHGIPKKAK